MKFFTRLRTWWGSWLSRYQAWLDENYGEQVTWDNYGEGER